jgi:ribosomal peptide maturation radical SAM protein 1
VQVLFVNMPFGSVRPAMGVSLLKGHLDRMGIPSRVLYLNLRYAQRCGREFFHTVADLSPPDALIGEWIFSPCVFEALAERKTDFVEMVSARFRPWLRQKEEVFFAELRRSRDEAPAFLEECLAAADWGSYDIVGFTTNFAQNVPSLALARRVKERYPHIQIAFGGANCEGAMGLQLHRSFPFIDFVFSGEADLSFPQFVERLRSGQDLHGIPGVISRRNGESHFIDLYPERVRDLDSLPYPGYDDYFEQEGETLSAPGSGYVLMETSRGCWWGEKQHCTFCGLNGSSMAYRSKSAPRALDEIFALTTRYHTNRVEMVDNILDMRYFQDLLPEIKRRGVVLDIFYETKANLRKDQVALLRAAGVSTIQPGIESFSTHVLRLMRKGTSALANVQLLKWCAEFGVKCNWNLIYGFPGEEIPDYEEMVALLAGLHHLKAPDGCGPIRVDRFSPFFTSPEAFGLCNVRHDRSYSYVYDLADDELANLAYYFEHDYADGRDLSTYSIALHEAVGAWEANAERSRLVYVDDGVTLTVQDGRVGAAQPEVPLTGPERALYLLCDQYRSWRDLVKEADSLGWSESDVEAFLRRLRELRLVASADGRYVSLAFPAVPPRAAAHADAGRRTVQLDETELQAVREKVYAWGPALTARERALLGELLGSERFDPDHGPEKAESAGQERP